MTSTLPLRRRRGRLSLVALATVASLVAAACGGGSSSSTSGGGDGTLSGNIEVSGSSTVEPISTWVAEEFETVEPDVLVNVDGPGTGDGFELFCNGDTDVSNASRPIKASEVEACEANGIEFIELKVAIDGLAVMTNTANEAVSCLSLEDLYALIGPESQGINNWSGAQALAAELGSTTQFPTAPLDITGPGEESGTFDTFVELAVTPVGKKRVEAGLISKAESETTRPDYVSQPNDNVIIQNIQGSPTSLGWVGYAYAQQASNVKLLEVRNSDGDCVAPNPQTIASGDYPLARDLYIYVNAERAEGAALSAYVDYYIEYLAEAAEAVGYVPLDSSATANTVSVWNNRTTGTADGGK